MCIAACFRGSAKRHVKNSDRAAILADGLFTTTLDVANAVVRIEAGEGIADGTEFMIFGGDKVVGEDTLTLIFEDESKWSYAQGILTYGISSCDTGTQGDLDGNGKVEFADLLVLSGNFGMDVSSHSEGDIDCNGKVEFADFLQLSANFGKDVGGAETVPEPSSLALFGIAAFFLGLLRRRRN